MRCLAICQIICSFFWMAPFAEGAVPNRDKPPGFSDGKPDYYEEIYDRTILGKSPAQIFSAINNGWGKNLASLRSALNPDASYLILHLQEPVDNYDFRSADQFRNSLMAKGITKMAQNTFGVGHFFLSWRCQKKEMFEGTVGMTGELDNQFRKALDLGWGLSAFWAIFEDGHLQTPELLDYEFEDSGNIHTLAIEVEPEVCGRAIAFVKSFLFHPNKPYTKFGLMPDPSRFEGGGCGSFAAAVLEKSGLFGDRKIPDFFRNSLRARSLLFGKGLQNPEETSFPDELLEQQGKISKEKLFLASSWNPFSGESGSPISFIDPEMTILFLKTIYRFSLEDLYRSHRALAERLHQSRIFAFRKIQEQDPLPIGFGNDTEPRSREIPINARFSEQSGLLVKETGSWIAGLFQRGFHARPALIQNGKEGAMAVILDRGYK